MMKLTVLSMMLLAVSAAPHVSHNVHQVRSLHRRQPLLHADLLALLQTEDSTDDSSSSSDSHGPYATGEVHGGNPYVVKAMATATASGALSTATAAEVVLAAASRPLDMNTQSWTDSSESQDSNDTQNDSRHGVPSWAIGLTTVLCMLLLGGLVAFAVIRYRRKRAADTGGEEKSTSKKPDVEDALSSYKAFWEQKRQSAGSFVSADATPAALASDLVAASLERDATRDSTLPSYREQDSQPSTPTVMTPSGERAPPRGFLYQ